MSDDVEGSRKRGVWGKEIPDFRNEFVVREEWFAIYSTTNKFVTRFFHRLFSTLSFEKRRIKKQIRILSEKKAKERLISAPIFSLGQT